MKKMFGKKLAFLLAAAVLAAGAFTSCEIDLGGDDDGSSSGSKLPDGTIKAVYDTWNTNGGINLIVFYTDTFVQAYTEKLYSIDDAVFSISREGTYKGDPTKDTGDNNKVLLTYTKLYDEYVDGGFKDVTPGEYVKEYPEWHLEDFTDLEATITNDGGSFECTEGFAYIDGYGRNKDY